MRRLMIGVIGGALVVTACAGSDSTSSDPTPAPVTEAPAEEPLTAAEGDEPAAPPAEEPSDTTGPPPTTIAPDASPDDEELGDDVPAPEPDPEPTTTLAPEPAAAPLGGRELGQALRPESATDGNPLPDLLVDDVRRETQVNLANVFPAELPVLVWAWAPH